ncbi:hypothetical protein TRFO_32180 [Tritrichomonas foetus]|uniref:PH domain-containing protein n=1 Tax=Tritrichomonas foetus TaxID=1144522 RepID=A0A1J4JTY2_9EUKA|nr:hypothetical protein TRFO_32180 [Tritrichomonas foetus]|eukprot:OHT00964.1 hypothetical protein TRFO_32180 [Tritrichomonas foetus]
MNAYPAIEISVLHPIMKTTAGKIYKTEQIRVVKRKGEQKKFLFVIANTGLYLFRKRKFPAGLKAAKYIELTQIKSLDVNSEFLSIFYKKKQVKIVSKTHIELAYFINTLYNTLFTRLEVKVDSSVQSAYDRESNGFETKSSLADRFIALSGSSIANQYIDLAQDIYTKLEQSPSSIVITPEIATSVFIDTLIEAIALDKQLHHLKLRKLTMGSFSSHLYKIFNTNRSIDTISLIDFSFAGYLNITEPLFSEKCVIQIKTLYFIRCEFNRPEFTVFVNEFSTYKGQISTLYIDSCTFNEQTIDTLFVSFFDADCFQYLENFALIGASMPERIQILYVQLLGSNWIIKHQSLRTINAMNTGIDAVFTIPILSMFENNVNSINFSGCKFFDCIDASNNSFQNLAEIDLSNCIFTEESLDSLFHSISMSQQQPSTLYLDSLDISGFHSFLKKASSYKKLLLESFSFNENKIDKSDYDLFFKFLKNMKNLKNLSLSYTLSPKSKKAYSYLNELIKSVPITSLMLRGKDDTSFDESFCSVLETIIDKKRFLSIDISGHKIQNKGIKLLIKLLKHDQLQELSFDGTGMKDPELFINLMEDLIESKVEYSKWPKNDIHDFTKNSSNEITSETMNKFNNVKKAFVQKFGIYSEQKAVDDYNAHEERSHSRRIRAESCIVYNLDSNLNSGNGNYSKMENEYDMEQILDILAIKEVDVQNVLVECFDNLVILKENDVLVKSLYDILNATSINNLNVDNSSFK